MPTFPFKIRNPVLDARAEGAEPSGKEGSSQAAPFKVRSSIAMPLESGVGREDGQPDGVHDVKL
ncbi:hypothetical protein CLAFUW4_01784 [Fulvia fulva]|uniref:Uncharacterized protein n=1 Tax=Passalora fulva TaxID=5499 RepID=A0A9Q8L5M2_PASFU|nr:uncharacterized protein CLAFUR5_01780 [Fulvia fulva]KAK4635441.1 hypothetical protein CLAFUR4_01782 [Fulvia fulva]KAK4636979.1 hypothetical protein CLAFUR0_01784 [Fulvia fulva]UJO11247.1 hypothetical protein CLAFUR5_01780 [Fulvia fulva]WPV08992.1 hypothetical protein CLAFUW4_01784 [Fulvia fulva]WPV25057.1 hypothetical protein CLAFUW7_01785 [Fulvia fulva]